MRRFLRENSFALFFGGLWVLQRGSPESKPVGAAHSDIGIEG